MSQREFRVVDDNEFMTAAEPIISKFIDLAFSEDARQATRLDATVQVTSLFQPALSRGVGAAALEGATSLGILVPNVGQLPWETIAEYRDHPGSQEAREKLLEFEHEAATKDPRDASDFLLGVARVIAHDLNSAVVDLQGTVAKSLGEEAINTAISFIPIAGPFLGPGASLTETAFKSVHYKRSWRAALMKLQPQS